MSQARTVLTRLAAFSLLWTVSTGLVAQSDDIEQEFDVGAGGTLSINSDSGPIEVNTWDQNRVRVRIRNTNGFEVVR